MNLENFEIYDEFTKKKDSNNKKNDESTKKDSNNKKKAELNIKSIFQKFTTLIITALGVCTALAWNEAFQNFFKNYDFLTKYGPWVYAIIITFVSLVSIIYLNKLSSYIELKD